MKKVKVIKRISELRPISEILFKGKINFDDVKQILEKCPDVFKGDSPWTAFVANLIRVGSADTHSWKFRKKEHNVCLIRLILLLGNKGIRFEERAYIGGWMLSEMLEEIPAYKVE